MSARLPGWDDLHYFLATARAGTLGGAAELLDVNPSTVQRRINRLEEDLRVRIFERSQRGYSLTAAGEQLFEHVAAMELEVLALGRKVGGLDETLAGAVRVATVDDLAVLVLTPLVGEFVRRHPRVTVQTDIHTGFTDLGRRQADVALRFGAKPREPNLIVKRVARVGVGLYASAGYLDERGRPASLEDLAEHDVICGDERMSGLTMERLMDRHAGRVLFRSNSFLVRVAAVRAGMGLGFVPYFVAAAHEDLERVDLPLPDLTSALWMLVHVDLRRNARVRAFVDHIYPALLELRPRFEHPPT